MAEKRALRSLPSRRARRAEEERAAERQQVAAPGDAVDPPRCKRQKTSTAPESGGTAGGKGKRKRSTRVEEEEEERDGDDEAESPAKKASRARARKQPPWTNDEIKMLTEIVTTSREVQLSWDYIYAKYDEWALQNGHPKRDKEAMRQKFKRERGPRQEFKWSAAEVRFLKEMQDRGATVDDIVREHTARFDQENRKRTRKAIREKLRAMPQAGEDDQDESHATEEGALWTTTVKYWTDAEHALLRKLNEGVTGYTAVQIKLRQLAQEKKLPVVKRTLVAIEKRMRLLRDNPQYSTRRRRRVWTKEHDDIVRDFISRQVRPSVAIRELATRLRVSEFQIKQRWRAISGQAPDKDEAEGVAQEREEAEVRAEQEQLQPTTPDGWTTRDFGAAPVPSGKESSDVEGAESDVGGMQGYVYEADRYRPTTPSLCQAGATSGE